MSKTILKRASQDSEFRKRVIASLGDRLISEALASSLKRYRWKVTERGDKILAKDSVTPNKLELRIESDGESVWCKGFLGHAGFFENFDFRLSAKLPQQAAAQILGRIGLDQIDPSLR